MNIDKMVHDLIEAQEVIDEPISIIRKTGQKNEVHNSCSGTGADLLSLQISAIIETFEGLMGDISKESAKSLKSAILKSVEDDIDGVINNNPTIH